MRSSSRRLGAALVLAAATAAGATGRITVAREATVAGATVRLGDIASLEGDLVPGVAALPLGPAPGAGESRRLDGAAILRALQRGGVDLDAVTYSIPAAVQVRRAAQEVDEAAVRTIVERFLADTAGAEGGDVVLRTIELPAPIRIPAGDYTSRVVAPEGSELMGRVRLRIDFVQEDRTVKSAWVTADVGVFGPVVVARRPIARGETIAADDLTLDRRDLSQVPHGAAMRIEDAAQMIAKLPVSPFTPIRRDQLEAPSAVHRGDVVLLVAERGGLRITVPGEVREDAGLGQQVHVVNRATRKDLVGRVVDPSTVVVEF
jgi:flagella basal body P-ring formation protein FlgA